MSGRKTEHQQRVEEFMRKAGQDLPSYPCVPNQEVRTLRAKLILEEALETIAALGFSPSVGREEKVPITIESVNFDLALGKFSIVDVADGCADISVVTIGTLSAFGIADAEILRLVDESNLRKFGPGGHRREDGKWIKPPDWEPPDLGFEIQTRQAFNDPVGKLRVIGQKTLDSLKLFRGLRGGRPEDAGDEKA